MKHYLPLLLLGLSLSPLGSAPAIRPIGNRIVLLGGEKRAESHPIAFRGYIPGGRSHECRLRDGQFLASGEESPRMNPSIAPRAWTYHVSVDPKSGLHTHSFSVPALGRASPSGERPTLTVKLRTDGLCEIFIDWGVVLGSELATAWRFDEETPLTSRWLQSTDSQAAFFFGDTDAFLRSLLGARQFVAQVTPDLARPITAVFPVDGFRAFNAEHPELLPLVFDK